MCKAYPIFIIWKVGCVIFRVASLQCRAPGPLVKEGLIITEQGGVHWSSLDPPPFLAKSALWV